MTRSTHTAGSIAILGANGRVSQAVARAFQATGWSIIAVSRNGRSSGFEGLANVECRAANALDEGALVRACGGAEVIFNGLNPPYTDWQEKALPMARNVLAAAKANKASQLFPGNVYNFGTSLPPILTEDTPFSADHSKARIRVAMETLFAQAAEQDGTKTVILRAGDFYGTEVGGSWFDQVMAKDLGKGRFTWPGERGIDHAWAYLPDLANAFVALAARLGDTRTFDVFHFEGHTLSGKRMHASAEQALGRPLKKGRFPRFILPLAGLFNPMMQELNAMMYLWDRPHRLDDSKLTAFLGHKPQVTPVDEAVARAISDLGFTASSTKAATSAQAGHA